MKAACKGHLESVRALVDHGTSLETKTRVSMVCAMAGSQCEVAPKQRGNQEWRKWDCGNGGQRMGGTRRCRLVVWLSDEAPR